MSGRKAGGYWGICPCNCQALQDTRALLLEWFQEASKHYRHETRDLHHRTGMAIEPPGWTRGTQHTRDTETK